LSLSGKNPPPRGKETVALGNRETTDGEGVSADLKGRRVGGGETELIEGLLFIRGKGLSILMEEIRGILFGKGVSK